MSTSLLTICTDALSEMSGFELPASFYGNGNLTARQCVSLVTREGRTLAREFRWNELIDEYTFTTSDGVESYDLPSDFIAFANMSQWDRTNRWRMSGPTPSIIWQWLNSGFVVNATRRRWFAIRGNQFMIYPTPSSTDTIAFDYYSKNWITRQSDSVNTNTFASDNDTVRIDADLLTLGLKWRFLQAKGMPYEPEWKEYQNMKDEVLADNAGKGVIDLNSNRRHIIPGGNLPESGYGQ